MDTGTLRRIVEDQHDEFERMMREEKIVEREGQEVARGFLAHPNILVVLGVRRCGKSVFSHLVSRGRVFGYVNFEDERLAGFGTSDFEPLLEAFYGLYGGELCWFVFDEIQDVRGWESFAARLRVNNRMIITGSNSRLLSSDASSALTGRHIDHTLFPFSFGEALAYQGVGARPLRTRDIGVVKKQIVEYLRMGGFPEAYRFGKRMVRGIYDDIVEKDVRARFGVRKQKELRDLARYLVTVFAGEVSYNKLKNVFGLNMETVKNYTEYLRSAYLVFFVDKFSYKLKQQFQTPRKVYCVDNGMIETIAFRVFEDAGRYMENCVAVQLLRQKFNEPRMEVFYWKDYQQHEVDFVVMRGARVAQLLQVTYASGRDEVEMREIRSMEKASRELGCRDMVMVTWDLEDKLPVQKGEIRCVPLWKWLLGAHEDGRSTAPFLGQHDLVSMPS
ncbi:MAG: ATP-binding protein [Candidatus Thermoplasmatota archaeon]